MTTLVARWNGSQIEFVDDRSGQVFGVLARTGASVDGQTPTFAALTVTALSAGTVEASGASQAARAVLVEQPAPEAFVGASVTLNSAAANSDLTVTAKVAATSIVTVALVNPEGTVAETTASATGTAITVTLACTDDEIVATAADVVAAIEADAACDALVSVTDEGDGSGVVDAYAATPLVNGTDNTIADKGTLIFADDESLWFATGDIAATDDLTNWVTLDVTAAGA